MSEATAHKPNHPYHLVDPSPWPVVGALAAGAFTGGMVLYMHDKVGFWGVLPGIFLILATMVGWWRDVIKEAEFQGHHTPVVQIGMVWRKTNPLAAQFARIAEIVRETGMNKQGLLNGYDDGKRPPR